MAEFNIQHSAAGIQKLETTLEAFAARPRECVVAIEISKGMLVNYLSATGYQLYPIPPAAVKEYRGRRRRTGAKSDRDDAQLLADILCLDLDLYSPLANDSHLARELQATYRARKQLVQHRTQLLNQLQQSLKAYFPAAIELFSRLDSQILHAFLTTFPTQRAAQAATEQELQIFFKQQDYTRTDRIPTIIEQLDQTFIPVPVWQAAAGQSFTAALLDQLAVLSEHIQRFEKRLTHMLDQHPDAPIFRSLPRVSTVLVAGLLGEIGDCRATFDDASSLQALAGTAPVTIQSGTSRTVSFRFACNKPLRNLFQEFARQSALPHASVWARGYFVNQLERGHSASRAYRALANRWASIIFRMWKDRTLYDENYHLRNIAQRGAKLPSKTYTQAA